MKKTVIKILLSIAILYILALSFNSWCFFYNLINYKDRYAGMTTEQEGLNTHYSQSMQPTMQQKKLGRIALKRFSGATNEERHNLALDIVRSKLLQGKTQSEIEKYLGSPKWWKITKQPTACFEAVGGLDSTCDLCIEYDNDMKSTKIYLDVN